MLQLREQNSQMKELFATVSALPRINFETHYQPKKGGIFSAAAFNFKLSSHDYI